MFTETQMLKQEYKQSRKPYDHSFRVDRRGLGVVKSLGPHNAKTFNEKVVKAFEAVESLIDNFKDDFLDLREDYAKFKAEGPSELQTRAAPIDPELELIVNEDHEQIKQILTDAITDREQLDYVNKAVDKILDVQNTMNTALSKLNADLNVYRVELKKGAAKGLNNDALANLKDEMSKVTVDMKNRVDQIVHAITNDLAARVVQLKEDVTKLDKSVDARVTTKVGAYAMTIDKLQKELKKLNADIDHKLGIKLTLVDDKVSEVDSKLTDINTKFADVESNIIKLTASVDEKLANQSKTSSSEVAAQVTDIRSTVESKIASVESKVQSTIQADVQGKVTTLNERINTVARDLETTLQSNIESNVQIINANIDSAKTLLDTRVDMLKSELNSVEANVAKITSSVDEGIKSSIADITNQIESMKSHASECVASTNDQIATISNELMAEINFIKDDLKNNTQSDIGLRHVVESLVSSVDQIQSDLSANTNNDDETKQFVQSVREELTDLGINLNTQLDNIDERLRTLSTTLRNDMCNVDDHAQCLDDHNEAIASINAQIAQFETDCSRFKNEVDDRFGTLTTTVSDHINFKPHPLDIITLDHQTKRHVGIPTDDIADYHLGQIVYFTVECYLYNADEKRFINVNDLEEPYADALNKQLVIYPSLATSGLWKEIAGVVTGINSELGVIQFASEGVYLVSDINDTASFGLGETIFFDPEKGIRIVADNATMTTKMKRLVLGTVTAIVDKHTVQVLK